MNNGFSWQHATITRIDWHCKIVMIRKNHTSRIPDSSGVTVVRRAYHSVTWRINISCDSLVYHNVVLRHTAQRKLPVRTNSMDEELFIMCSLAWGWGEGVGCDGRVCVLCVCVGGGGRRGGTLTGIPMYSCDLGWESEHRD